MRNKTKRNLLVTLADKNYVEQAKQLFSSVYFNAGWKGDYMLLSYKIPGKKLKWFKDKEILIKKRSFSSKNLGLGKWPPVIFNKLYLFTPEFKKWQNIIFLDVDIIVRASLDELTKIKGFAAVGGWHHLSKLFLGPLSIRIRKIDKNILNKLKKNYNLRESTFKSSVMAFETDIIRKDTFSKLKKLLQAYEKIIYGDEPIVNLLFYKKWIKLPLIYNIHPYYFIKLNNLRPSKIKGIILHFPKYKPWLPKSPFYKEWKNNLDKAELIDLKKIPPVREKWTKEDIERYCKYLRKRHILYYHKHVIWKISIFIDKCFGLIGIFLKNNFPKLYFKLKKLKKKLKK